ncbi:MAG: 50S ribosomal protein L31 [Parcubacteria group bacterium]
MNTSIHPTYFPEAKIVCACGNTFTAGSTKNEIRVEVCSNCHPFYTGKQRFVDTQRRLDRFQKIMEKKTALQGKRRSKKTAEA